MNTNYETKILERINSLLSEIKYPHIMNQHLFFVMDENVNYDMEWTVLEGDLFPLERLNEIIKPVINKGPSWIHANFVSTAKDFNLITLKFGALVGNPNPSINVSLEPNSKIKIT